MIRPITAAAGLCLAGAALFVPSPAMAAPPDLTLCATVPADAQAGAVFQVAASGPDVHVVRTFNGPAGGCSDTVDLVSGPFQVTAAVMNTGCPALNTGTDCHVPKFSHFEVDRDGQIQRIYSEDSTAYVTPPNVVPNYPGGQTKVTAVFINS